MNDYKKKPKVIIEDSRFIFKTNFSGDPDRGYRGSTARKATIIINNEDVALELLDMGVNVKKTEPREGEEKGFMPVYYVAINCRYDSKTPPRIFLVTGDADPVLLDEQTVGQLDRVYVLSVDVTLNIWESDTTGQKSLYINDMYVEQDADSDPFAHKYGAARRVVED